jgi:hypothetical protein
MASVSRSLHGHMYVLPVADWVLEANPGAITPKETMVGLGGRADRARVIEALARLTEIGALRELPRPEQKNAARCFERVEHPYWELVAAYGSLSRGGVRSVGERVPGS